MIVEYGRKPKSFIERNLSWEHNPGHVGFCRRGVVTMRISRLVNVVGRLGLLS